MYFYKENIELHKLKAENSKFEFHAVNRWYEDIKNHGIKNHLIINDKNIIKLGGTRYFILKLLKTNNPCGFVTETLKIGIKNLQGFFDLSYFLLNYINQNRLKDNLRL